MFLLLGLPLLAYTVWILLFQLFPLLDGAFLAVVVTDVLRLPVLPLLLAVTITNVLRLPMLPLLLTVWVPVGLLPPIPILLVLVIVALSAS